MCAGESDDAMVGAEPVHSVEFSELGDSLRRKPRVSEGKEHFRAIRRVTEGG